MGLGLVSGAQVSRARYGLAAVAFVVGGIWWLPGGASEEARVETDLAADDEASDRAVTEATGTEAAEAAERQAAAAGAEERRDAAEAAEKVDAEAAEAAAADAARGAAQEAERQETERQLAAAATWTVHNVVDGDTIDVRHADGRDERVRIIGIDTPERGECGFGPATSAMAALVDGEEVELVAGARDDRDRYDRIIRYVDVEGADAGLALIEQGLAISRYDLRDGYGRHEREAVYVAADRGLTVTCEAPTAPAPSPPASGAPGGGFANCTAARDAGAAPVHRDDPGYHSRLDRDGDGVGCE